MVPAILPIPPDHFRTILELDGYSLRLETENNWTLYKVEADYPVIVIPKHGDLISVSIMMGILDQIGMDNKRYFSLLAKVIPS